MKKVTPLIAAVALVLLGAISVEAKIYLGQGSMVGEVDQTSAILQTRLTATTKLVEEDVPGSPGVAQSPQPTNKPESAKNSPAVEVFNSKIASPRCFSKVIGFIT